MFHGGENGGLYTHKKKNKALLHAEELCSMVEKMEVCTRTKKQKKQGPAARRRIVLHGEQMEVCTRKKNKKNKALQHAEELCCMVSKWRSVHVSKEPYSGAKETC